MNVEKEINFTRKCYLRFRAFQKIMMKHLAKRKDLNIITSTTESK